MPKLLWLEGGGVDDTLVLPVSQIKGFRYIPPKQVTGAHGMHGCVMMACADMPQSDHERRVSMPTVSTEVQTPQSVEKSLPTFKFAMRDGDDARIPASPVQYTAQSEEKAIKILAALKELLEERAEVLTV